MNFTPLTFAVHLAAVGALMDRQTARGLEEAGQIVETEAKRVLGTYEYGWPPLSDVTIDKKGGRDTPGIDTEEMRNSLGHHVSGHSAVQIGTDDQKAVWFELGTTRQPPRSFLQQALVRKTPEVVRAIGHHVSLAFPASVVTYVSGI